MCPDPRACLQESQGKGRAKGCSDYDNLSYRKSQPNSQSCHDTRSKLCHNAHSEPRRNTRSKPHAYPVLLPPLVMVQPTLSLLLHCPSPFNCALWLPLSASLSQLPPTSFSHEHVLMPSNRSRTSANRTIWSKHHGC